MMFPSVRLDVEGSCTTYVPSEELPAEIHCRVVRETLKFPEKASAKVASFLELEGANSPSSSARGVGAAWEMGNNPRSESKNAVENLISIPGDHRKGGNARKLLHYLYNTYHNSQFPNLPKQLHPPAVSPEQAQYKMLATALYLPIHGHRLLKQSANKRPPPPPQISDKPLSFEKICAHHAV